MAKGSTSRISHNSSAPLTSYNSHTSRISFDQYIMVICHAVAERATCLHRCQGAVIVRDKRIISTGYNGAPPGVKDCLERKYCRKSESLPCQAEGLHGESNAIITAATYGISVKGSILYCIYSPCRACCNMIKTAGIEQVVYEHIYEGFKEGPEYMQEIGLSFRQTEFFVQPNNINKIGIGR